MLPASLSCELQKYTLLTDFKNKNGLLIADISYQCPWNSHKNNNRYLTINPQEEKIILKCHSQKCHGKSKILYHNQQCNITCESDNKDESKELQKDDHNVSPRFDINMFNSICDHSTQQEIDNVLTKMQKLEKDIDTLCDNIANIDYNLKTNIINQQKQEINKQIRQKEKNIKLLKYNLKTLFKKQSALELEKKSAYFEKYHAKIMQPFCFLRISDGDFYLYNKKHFEDAYANLLLNNDTSFVSTWLLRSNMKTYERLDFLPPPKKIEPHIYNTFSGLKVETQGITYDYNSDLIEPILKHVNVLVNHDNNSYEYVLNYLAHIVQKPGELPGVALVFRSEKEGVGKNLIFENFFGHSILGDKYVLQTTDIDKILGRFSMANNRLLVILDETRGKDTFLNNEKIKNRITTERVPWEKKGIDGIKINNFARELFFTNNDTPVSIPFGDRRFAGFDCSNEVANNRPYFKKLVKILNDPQSIYSFYYFLKNRDISKFDIVADRPETDFYKELREQSTPCVARFLIHYIFKENPETKV